MTNLLTYQTEIEGDIARFKTAVEFAKGTDEEKAEAVDRAWAVLDECAGEVRSRYVAFREETIANARKQVAGRPYEYGTAGESVTANIVATDVHVNLTAANDSTEQNAILKKLEGTLRYLTDGVKSEFRPHILTINELLIDKAASKASLQAVITEVKNVARPYEDALAEAEALPTVIGEEYDTLKAERDAELEAEKQETEESEE